MLLFRVKYILSPQSFVEASMHRNMVDLDVRPKKNPPSTTTTKFINVKISMFAGGRAQSQRRSEILSSHGRFTRRDISIRNAGGSACPDRMGSGRSGSVPSSGKRPRNISQRAYICTHIDWPIRERELTHMVTLLLSWRCSYLIKFNTGSRLKPPLAGTLFRAGGGEVRNESSQ